MAFEKGNSLGGRKKGSLNKVRNDMKKTMIAIVEGNVEEFQRRLDALSDSDYIRAYLSCVKYVIPTLKSQEVKMEVKHPETPDWILDLSAEDVDKIEKSLE